MKKKIRRKPKPQVKFELTHHTTVLWTVPPYKPDTPKRRFQIEYFRGFFPTRRQAWETAEEKFDLGPYLSRDRLLDLNMLGKYASGYSVKRVPKSKEPPRNLVIIAK